MMMSSDRHRNRIKTQMDGADCGEVFDTPSQLSDHQLTNYSTRNDRTRIQKETLDGSCSSSDVQSCFSHVPAQADQKKEMHRKAQVQTESCITVLDKKPLFEEADAPSSSSFLNKIVNKTLPHTSPSGFLYARCPGRPRSSMPTFARLPYQPKPRITAIRCRCGMMVPAWKYHVHKAGVGCAAYGRNDKVEGSPAVSHPPVGASVQQVQGVTVNDSFMGKDTSVHSADAAMAKEVELRGSRSVVFIPSRYKNSRYQQQELQKLYAPAPAEEINTSKDSNEPHLVRKEDERTGRKLREDLLPVKPVAREKEKDDEFIRMWCRCGKQLSMWQYFEHFREKFACVGKGPETPEVAETRDVPDVPEPERDKGLRQVLKQMYDDEEIDRVVDTLIRGGGGEEKEVQSPSTIGRKKIACQCGELLSRWKYFEHYHGGFACAKAKKPVVVEVEKKKDTSMVSEWKRVRQKNAVASWLADSRAKLKTMEHMDQQEQREEGPAEKEQEQGDEEIELLDGKGDSMGVLVVPRDRLAEIAPGKIPTCAVLTKKILKREPGEAVIIGAKEKKEEEGIEKEIELLDCRGESLGVMVLPTDKLESMIAAKSAPKSVVVAPPSVADARGHDKKLDEKNRPLPRNLAILQQRERERARLERLVFAQHWHHIVDSVACGAGDDVREYWRWQMERDEWAAVQSIVLSEEPVLAECRATEEEEQARIREVCTALHSMEKKDTVMVIGRWRARAGRETAGGGEALGSGITRLDVDELGRVKRAEMKEKQTAMRKCTGCGHTLSPATYRTHQKANCRPECTFYENAENRRIYKAGGVAAETRRCYVEGCEAQIYAHEEFVAHARDRHALDCRVETTEVKEQHLQMFRETIEGIGGCFSLRQSCKIGGSEIRVYMCNRVKCQSELSRPRHVNRQHERKTMKIYERCTAYVHETHRDGVVYIKYCSTHSHPADLSAMRLPREARQMIVEMHAEGVHQYKHIVDAIKARAASHSVPDLNSHRMQLVTVSEVTSHISYLRRIVSSEDSLERQNKLVRILNGEEVDEDVMEEHTEGEGGGEGEAMDSAKVKEEKKRKARRIVNSRVHKKKFVSSTMWCTGCCRLLTSGVWYVHKTAGCSQVSPFHERGTKKNGMPCPEDGCDSKMCTHPALIEHLRERHGADMRVEHVTLNKHALPAFYDELAAHGGANFNLCSVDGKKKRYFKCRYVFFSSKRNSEPSKRRHRLMRQKMCTAFVNEQYTEGSDEVQLTYCSSHSHSVLPSLLRLPLSARQLIDSNSRMPDENVVELIHTHARSMDPPNANCERMRMVDAKEVAHYRKNPNSRRTRWTLGRRGEGGKDKTGRKRKMQGDEEEEITEEDVEEEGQYDDCPQLEMEGGGDAGGEDSGEEQMEMVDASCGDFEDYAVETISNKTLSNVAIEAAELLAVDDSVTTGEGEEEEEEEEAPPQLQPHLHLQQRLSTVGLRAELQQGVQHLQHIMSGGAALDRLLTERPDELRDLLARLGDVLPPPSAHLPPLMSVEGERTSRGVAVKKEKQSPRKIDKTLSVQLEKDSPRVKKMKRMNVSVNMENPADICLHSLRCDEEMPEPSGTRAGEKKRRGRPPLKRNRTALMGVSSPVSAGKTVATQPKRVSSTDRPSTSRTVDNCTLQCAGLKCYWCGGGENGCHWLGCVSVGCERWAHGRPQCAALDAPTVERLVHRQGLFYCHQHRSEHL